MPLNRAEHFRRNLLTDVKYDLVLSFCRSEDAWFILSDSPVYVV